jgi:hypothetical protein
VVHNSDLRFFVGAVVPVLVWMLVLTLVSARRVLRDWSLKIVPVLFGSHRQAGLIAGRTAKPPMANPPALSLRRSLTVFRVPGGGQGGRTFERFPYAGLERSSIDAPERV